MVRGFMLGLFFSAALTLFVCKALDSRRAVADPALAAATLDTNVPAPATSDSSQELSKLRGENEGLARDIATAKAEIAKTAALKTAAVEAAAANPWKTLASKLMAFIKAAKSDPKSSRKGAQEVMVQMMAVMGAIAKEKGISLDDAMMTPDGIPALIMAALEDADPPLSDSEREGLRKALADAATDWDEFQKTRDGKTSLEQKVDLMKGSFRASEALAAAVSPEHADVITTMKAFGTGLSAGISGGFFSSHGPRDQIRKEFGEQWAKTFKLDPSQASLLDPIVEEYLGACDASEAELRKPAAGTKDPLSQSTLRRVEAQVAAQQRIAKELSLNAEQQTALSNWRTTYMYWDAPADTSTEPKTK